MTEALAELRVRLLGHCHDCLRFRESATAGVTAYRSVDSQIPAVFQRLMSAVHETSSMALHHRPHLDHIDLDRRDLRGE
ncbi:hypothetical protein [Streptomyces sp. SID11385]|uniref:hypothetical protein n=1 Tax=Streptomyces sp. SID11385 TaxID=2706031 RepID=UPI0013CC9888|nr:hypothetical protein [Streptomyces sp. SID11385]NEA39821.1 hypothetical protein [Streptomyces sp. SID11385]